MKRKWVAVGAIALAAAVLGFWLLTRPVPLGNINQSYSAPETSNASVSFSGEAGSRIKISFASHIKSGELDIVVYDPSGAVVKELDQATELETFLALEDSGVYRLEARCQNFTGSFKVAVYQWD